MLLMRMKKEDFESVIDINLVGTFNVTKNVTINLSNVERDVYEKTNKFLCGKGLLKHL